MSNSFEIREDTRRLIKRLTITSNHFPKHERFGLQKELKEKMYSFYSKLMECECRYYNKTAVTELAVLLYQICALVNLAYDMGYLLYNGEDQDVAAKRHLNLSIPLVKICKDVDEWKEKLRIKK
ncbi:MAG: four helix bundle protein [Kiritimatiellia bacterium]